MGTSNKSKWIEESESNPVYPAGADMRFNFERMTCSFCGRIANQFITGRIQCGWCGAEWQTVQIAIMKKAPIAGTTGA